MAPTELESHWEHRCPCGVEVRAEGEVCPDCKKARKERREALRAWDARVPPRYAWANSFRAPELGSRVDASALAYVRGMDIASLDRMTFVGQAGAGKSSLAILTAGWWCWHTGRTPRFSSAPDLGVARQQTQLGREADLVHHALRAPLLILDDAGAEAPAGSTVITHVLQHRYDEALPTITTSGLTPVQMIERYGSGIGRRLLDKSGGVVVLDMKKSNVLGLIKPATTNERKAEAGQ